MVKIQIRGHSRNQDKDDKQSIVYDIPDAWITNSKTIQQLFDYISRDDEPLYLGVSEHDWQAYIDFMQNNEATVAALRVIDYLDDVEQVKTWYRCWYRVTNVTLLI